MLHYVVLDPDVLSAECLADPGRRTNTLQLLRTLRQNTLLLLIDSRGVIQEAIKQCASSLSVGDVSIREELQQLVQSRRYIECSVHARDAAQERNAWPVVSSLGEECVADATITVPDRCQGSGRQRLSIQDYIESRFEPNALTTRRSIRLDELSEDQIDDIWMRTLTFTRWLRLYDQFFGRAENALRFADGIKYLVDQWLKHAHMQIDSPKLEIFTSVYHPPVEGESKAALDIRSRENGLRATERRAELSEMLTGSGVALTVRFMDVEKRLFHRRALKTAHATFTIDRGYDFFDANENWVTNFLEFNSSLKTYLAEIERSPELLQNSSGKWLVKGR
jgi:hypothetical protein